VRRSRRLLLERLHDHPLDVLVADRARLARPRLVVQPIEPGSRVLYAHLGGQPALNAYAGSF
jgi:hypothetical protein